MIESIIDGVSIKLNTTFGDTHRIYVEDIKQGLQEPCFFIATLEPTMEQIIGSRYRQDVPLVMTYFPSVEGNNTEMHSVADTLFEELEYITLQNGDLVRGRKLRAEIVDGILHFFVTFTVFLQKLKTETPMETVSVEAGIVKE